MQEETFEGDEYVNGIDYGDGFKHKYILIVYLSPNVSHCIY